MGVWSPSRRDQLRAVGRDGRERVVVQLAAGDDWDGVVEQADQRPREPGLGLAALAQEDDVLAGEDGVLDRRDDRVVVADDAREDRLLRGQPASRLARSSSLTGRGR